MKGMKIQIRIECPGCKAVTNLTLIKPTFALGDVKGGFKCTSCKSAIQVLARASQVQDSIMCDAAIIKPSAKLKMLKIVQAMKSKVKA